MKIGVDIRVLLGGKRTGVEEYTISLLENIFELDKENEYLLFLNDYKGEKVDLGWVKKFPNVKLKRFGYPNKLLNFSFWYLGWPKIDKMLGGVDVVFLPNVNFAPVSDSVKLVATFHDLSFERYPETFSFKRRLWHFFVNPKKIAQRADRIIAVSDSTKNDLVNIYGIDPIKMEVIYSGISNELKFIGRNNPSLLEVKEKYGLPFKFIFYLGTIEPRKNIIGLVKAYNQLRKLENSKLNHKLVISGTKGWKTKKILKAIKESPYRADILTGYVKDEDKVFAYNLASVFVYPSFFEGFGFPPLEAMRCRVPVVCSNNSSMPEIVGGAGVMVDPDRPDEIFQAIKEIILNKNFSENLRERGVRRSLKFNWRNSAKKTLATFKGDKA